MNPINGCKRRILRFDENKTSLPAIKCKLHTRAEEFGAQGCPSFVFLLMAFNHNLYLFSGYLGILCSEIPFALLCLSEHPTIQQLCTIINLRMR